jgi:hypothetical protein
MQENSQRINGRIPLRLRLPLSERTTTVVTFKNPPRAGRDEVYEKVEALKANPGEWGIVRTYEHTKQEQRAAHTYASHIRNGRFPAFRGCDAMACTEADGVHVYAKWVSDGATVTP